LEELLTMRGFAVETAEDGETALARTRERPPDVVLLDVMMPRMNGFDVCRRLKGDAATAAIPVLLVTSLDAREDRLAGIGAGANDFLTKPIDAADLLLRVRNAVLTKRLFDREAEQRRQLEALEAARDTLTHMIVHDIRSPLTGLHAYLGLLDRAAAEGALGDVLEFAREAHVLQARGRGPRWRDRRRRCPRLRSSFLDRSAGRQRERVTEPGVLVAANRAGLVDTVLQWLLHDVRNPVQTLAFLPEIASSED